MDKKKQNAIPALLAAGIAIYWLFENVKGLGNNYIGKYFTLKEVVNPSGNSVDTPEQRTPSSSVILEARRVAAILDLFREQHPDTIIKPTSWYRSPAENTRVGGEKTSNHQLGNTVDFSVWRNGQKVNREFYEWLINQPSVNYDEVILYGSVASPVFIHFSAKPSNLREKWLASYGEGHTTTYSAIG